MEPGGCQFLIQQWSKFRVLHLRPTEEASPPYLAMGPWRNREPPSTPEDYSSSNYVKSDVGITKGGSVLIRYNYGKEGEAAMYFFTSRDRSYPIGNRRIRAAVGGFWKATASKLAIGVKNNPIGYKRVFVYQRGTFEESTKSDWLMQEYTLPHNTSTSSSTNMKLNTFVLCKIYRKSTKSTVPSTISSR
ncbi:hypothetical protein LWI28_027372 [Acer negundo]|uniref:NAC domain-containing protein n=1 Tax=Acer negundo TaxID=4023 RepID=A0AAD5IGH3_ACENE|nr:hypothetical protein LWI28_027372 [Acer negundo]